MRVWDDGGIVEIPIRRSTLDRVLASVENVSPFVAAKRRCRGGPCLDITRMWSVPRYDATKREKWRVANFILPASQQKCFMTGYESGLA